MHTVKKTTSRRSRAVAKLSSWLKASKIPHEPQTGGGLLVQSRDGGQVLVVITEGAPAPATALAVDLESIWSRDMGEAIQAFHMVTQALGWGTPQPVPVRAKPAELTHHDFWMRHTEVAVSPNPDPEVFTRYKPIIDVRVRRFCSNPDNRRLLWEIAMDEGDVRSLAMMWVVSYECSHKVLLSTDHDNEKLLHSFLEQRFAELHGRMVTMSRDMGFVQKPVMPPGGATRFVNDLPRIGVDWVAFDENRPIESQFQEDDSPLDELEDAEGPRERKKIANGLLRTALKKMPKSIAVQKLEDLATSPDVDADVSAKAIEHLERLTRSRKKGRSNNA